MQSNLFGGDVFPRSSVTTKLSTYSPPSGAPMTEEEAQAYRNLIVDFVFIAWRKLHRPVTLEEIYGGVDLYAHGILQEHIMGVHDRVQSRIDNDLWPYTMFPRGKRTVDRRVNESAAPDFYSDNKARIVCVQPGLYQVHPELLEK